MYKIRCRVAEPGTTVSPPASPPTRPPRKLRKDWTPRSNSPQTADESYDDESESDESSGGDIVEFAEEECLFCRHISEDFDENLSHMRQSHSFIVPFQSLLAVDLETLVSFLHMVIFSYRECICCGKRRRTIEAVQQHMMTTGHCRFNMTEEITSFYDEESLGQQVAENFSRPDERTLRLPSGKLLAHRSSTINPTPRTRLRDKPELLAPSDSSTLPTTSHSATTSQALARTDRRERALSVQLAQLRTADQTSLVHLPEAEQRSLLAVHKKGVDGARRAERRERRRLDDVGNKTSVHTKYYKQEVPVYMGG